MSDERPYVSPADDPPQLTFKALGLGVLLSIILGAANVYLGLKAGLTVAASIPAAVISMGVLRLFKRSTILENNIVQTAASAGEALAAGVLFTLPALVILGVWDHFDYWQTTIIAALGGLIGVGFTIPLRRALIVSAKLKFPEGVATAEVLKIGDKAGADLLPLVFGALAGALFKIGETGLRLWTDAAHIAGRIGSSVGYIGMTVAPALVGVGYIVGLNIAALVFIGGAINWFIAIPIVAAMHGDTNDAAADVAWSIWRTQTRYIGVGAMVVGGLWALIRLWPSLVEGIGAGLALYRKSRDADAATPNRTEMDAPLPWIFGALALSVIPLYFVFEHVTHDMGIAAIMALIMLIAGFLFSAVAAYMAGLVGSSNNPVSGVTIATLLTAALLLLALGVSEATGPTAAILIGAVVCCAAAIGGDNMQDLKTGHLVGATPWKQQIAQCSGVLAGSFVMAPVLTLLLKAYGIGPIAVAGQTPLPAPQSTLMASVAKGVFARDLPWTMVLIGAGVAIGVIVLDVMLEKKRAAFRAPVLAVAVGLYLPLDLGVAMMLGGVVAYAADRFHLRRSQREEAQGELQATMDAMREIGARNGLLLAAGLITGEALLGIGLAIPLVIDEGSNPMAIGPEHPPSWPGVVLLVGVVVMLYRAATRGKRNTGN
ncbi:MAG: oligopeptide transporter, OPT family [Planctomycetes bacterium]|nr:oligopeptide transporter, OPT family [Planctomycetota bacterium]